MFNIDKFLQQPIVFVILAPLFVLIVGTLIVYRFFGIGKQKKNKASRSTAIINNGKGNAFIDNVISGFDVRIEDNGEDTVAIRNKILGKK